MDRIFEALAAVTFIILVILVLSKYASIYVQRLEINPQIVPHSAVVLTYISSLPGNFEAILPAYIDNESEFRIFFEKDRKYYTSIGYCFKHDLAEELKQDVIEGALSFIGVDLIDVFMSYTIDYMTQGGPSELSFMTTSAYVSKHIGNWIANRFFAKASSKLAAKLASVVTKKFISKAVGWFLRLGSFNPLGFLIGLGISIGINMAFTLGGYINRWLNQDLNCYGDVNFEYYELDQAYYFWTGFLKFKILNCVNYCRKPGEWIGIYGKDKEIVENITFLKNEEDNKVIIKYSISKIKQ